MTISALVIGESCVDEYHYCDCERIAPDRPVPIVEIIESNKSIGMAGNVFENIKSLGMGCNLVTNSNWIDIKKERFVHKTSNHMFLRVDTRMSYDKFQFSELDLSAKYIVISDYNKGFLTENDIENICANHPNVFVDTKKKLNSWIANARFIKINNHEYEKSREYLESSGLKNVIKTSGSSGAFYLNEHFPVDSGEVIDVSGAGDTFLAGLVVGYDLTNDIRKAIVFANSCASTVVRRKGVTPVRRVDILTDRQ
jgi:bifunctional ADP-heptose synthase (sugar kinase/adenylyltransferase)